MKKVLIVEDEPNLQKAYKQILSKHGYNVKVAGDGQEALDMVKEFQPKMILLDMKMPKVSGLDFLNKFPSLKSDPAIVVFSNIDDQKDIQQALKAGAKRYLLKAWASPKDLVKVVEDAMKY